MYFQCDPNEDVANWNEDRIWDAFRSRVNGNGFELKEGPVIDKMVLKFRSFVHAPMRHGKLFLAGDAAHTVPPTGAKGLNLALHDVKVLFEGLDSFYSTGSTVLLDAYSDRALDRVWKAQQFSYWMTSMLHTPGRRRRLLPRPPARRTQHRGVLPARPRLPRGGVHRLAGRALTPGVPADPGTAGASGTRTDSAGAASAGTGVRAALVGGSCPCRFGGLAARPAVDEIHRHAR